MSHRAAFGDAINLYKDGMMSVVSIQDAVADRILTVQHFLYTEKAEASFRDYPKFRDDKMFASYQKMLKDVRFSCSMAIGRWHALTLAPTLT